jgi:hypothetical protein
MTSPETIPLIDQVAADCLRGMLADQYFKPDDKREGARQAYQLASELLEKYGQNSSTAPSARPPSHEEVPLFSLFFARAALSGMLANPHTRHVSPEAWADAAEVWALAMLAARAAT